MTWDVKQTVDFFTDEYKPEILPKSVQYLLLSFVVCLVVSVVAYASVYVWHKRGMERDQYYQAEVNQLDNEYAQLQQLAEQLKPSSVLLKKEQSLKDRVAKNEQVFDYLKNQSFDGRESMTNPVDQLGQAVMNGVWLSGFEIYPKGVRLMGFVNTPNLLPKYLKRLSALPAYSGQTFEYIDIQKTKEGLSFVLDSQSIKDSEKEKASTRRYFWRSGHEME